VFRYATLCFCRQLSLAVRLLKMNQSEILKSLLQIVWETETSKKLETQKVDTSLYEKLAAEIPDKYIHIEDVFSEEKIKEILGNYNDELNKFNVVPFLGTLGATVICIGTGEGNKGKVSLHDYDFGHYELEQTLQTFLNKLVSK